MRAACIQYLTERMAALVARDGETLPYQVADPETERPASLFFEELPLDYLKDHDWGACCLPLQDRNKPFGQLIAKRLDAEELVFRHTRRRFVREIVFRCLLYAPSAVELWGDADHVGLVDQLVQLVAEHRLTAAVSDGSAIKVEPQDVARPWDTATEQDRKLRRSRLAIVRVSFSGGVQVVSTLPAISSVNLVPQVGGSQ